LTLKHKIGNTEVFLDVNNTRVGVDNVNIENCTKEGFPDYTFFSIEKLDFIPAVVLEDVC
jgi:hypothetical protein